MPRITGCQPLAGLRTHDSIIQAISLELDCSLALRDKLLYVVPLIGKSMKINRILISLIALLFSGTLISKSAFSDDAVLKRLTSLRLTINVPEDSGPLSFRIRNMVELKLRQAGLDVRDTADAELRLNVFWIDLDPEKKKILGKYGTLELSLRETVFLARDAKVRTTAQTWEGHLRLLHGPPDTFPDRTMQFASELVDEFLNNWLKARK